MDIHQLELFLAVMDSPSMTQAAGRVCSVSYTHLTLPTNREV